MNLLPETVPFFSQWETPDMTMDVLAEGAEVALRRDPLWKGSGAETLDEYAVWAANICGMACLKMILATARRDRSDDRACQAMHSIWRLRRQRGIDQGTDLRALRQLCAKRPMACGPK